MEMTMKYFVNWAYRDGNTHSQGFEDFAAALEFYRARREGNRPHVDVSIGSELAEHDGERWHDGLTDDERDQL